MGCLSVLLCLVSQACSDEENGQQYSPATYTVSGKVEKGPFISGSTITMQPMDANMHALGTVFTSTITNHLGNFTFGSQEFETPFAQLTATGYFFNEVNGELSQGMLTLKAAVNLADKSTVNVNILTHLKYQRILNLVAQKKSFDEANKQAQKELLAAFGLQRYVDTDVSQYSIVSGTDEAGALIAISSLLLGDRTEAELTQYLAELSEEFGNNGKFSEPTMEQIREDRKELSYQLGRIAENVVYRYEELDMEVSVKDLSYYFDWDDDGIAGNEIADGEDAVKLEKTELKVPQEGGTYSIHVDASIPVRLTPPEGSLDVPDQLNGIYQTGSVTLEKALEGETLTLVVEPAAYRIVYDVVVNLYDVRGKVMASLTVSQEGNPTGKLFSETGSDFILKVSDYLSQTMSMCNNMDKRYTKLISAPDFTAPVSADNSNLLKCWKSLYDAINAQNTLLQQDKVSGMNLLNPSWSTLNAFCYYNLMTYWGDVPYITGRSMEDYMIPRTPIVTIQETLIGNLKVAVGELEEKKNDYVADSPDCIFFSKDVARIVLSYIYMWQNKYAEAKELLEQVVSNGYYRLESGTEYSPESEEVILGFRYDDGSRGSVSMYPVLTYADVILSLAECDWNMENEASAASYLQQIAARKNLAISTDVKEGIKEMHRYVSRSCGGYFGFLKRNGMAISELGLKEYQLLLPIPWSEVARNPNLVQNPYY